MSLIRLSKYFSKQVDFVSIDVGIKNMGIVWGNCDVRYKKIEFERFILLDLTKIIPKEKSGAQGYNHLIDKFVEAFGIDSRDNVFKNIDMIFVEYQPPQGQRIIQEFLVYFFKDKVIFTQPRTMHKFFRVDKLSYEDRKYEIERQSVYFMHMEFYKKWIHLERRHDISDAICLVVYYIIENR